MSVTETPTGILTFLIADVRGYTSFTQSHGDEGAARLADKFAEIAREGVGAHGGEVTELRGDEALAVFSSPRAAVRAAIDLQMVFADESVIDPSLPLTVGIGIDAGEAVPVQGGYRGGALNLAARLCSKAAAGEVLVSSGIAHLTRAVEGVKLVEAGQTEVKGLSAPVQVFRAEANRERLVAVPGAGEMPSALDAVTPIVGREAEARRLRWLWRLARRGTATTCLVFGPPGIGKTRLTAEIATTAAGSGGDCRYASFAAAAGAVDVDVASMLAEPRQRPQLIVIDDIEVADQAQLGALSDAVSNAAGPTLVLLVVEDESATTETLTTVRRLAGADDHVVRPRPLTLEEMLRVAGFYVGGAVGSLPHDLLSSTGGVPRLVHEKVSEWAQGHAARRLGDLATAAATGRSDLRTVESDLAGTVIDLQLVREQATLFGLGPGRCAPEPTESPYRGLASFSADDADFFFGRERLVAELIAHLAGSALVGVVGASGSGKSSAVRAGLVPALASGVLPGSDSWTVGVLRPGEHPMRALDRALWSALPSSLTAELGDRELDLERVAGTLSQGERLVVVVDQFEEAFTLCQDDAERTRFLSTLATAAAAGGQVTVVVAIRADYYGRCAADPLLAELLAANQVLVGPMTAEEYRRAIVQPALRVGAAVEPELVDDLVAEVLGEPGALPLLSTALQELWERRDGRTLRRTSYVETGGVHGAVARLADDVFASFDEQQQLVARGVLLRLAGPGIGDAVVRRRVPLAEFDVDRDGTARDVLDVLAARRLVTVSDGSAEVAHEALLREWPRLQTWLEEDREGRRLRAHLATAAQEWAAREQDDAELYRGARLSAALDWTTDHNSELNETEREFITASRSASQAELHRQQRQNRRLRGLLAGVVGVLVLALVAGSVAIVQRRSAQRAAREALARQLGAEAVNAPRIDQAMLLARQGVLLDNSSFTQGTLLATLLRAPTLRATLTMPIQIRPQRLALSTDGRTLAVSGNDGKIRFFDVATRTLRKTVLPDWYGFSVWTVGPDFVYDHYNAKANTVTLDVYDATTLKLQRSLPFSKLFLTQPTSPNMPCFGSTDHQRFYCAFTVVDPATSGDRQAYMESWDLRTGAHRMQQLPGVGMNVAGPLPDGDVLAATDDAIVTVDGSTLRIRRQTRLRLGQGSGALSPDGATMAWQSGGPDSAPAETFSLISTRTGHRRTLATAHTAGIQALGFDPGGRYIVSTGDDSRVVVWDAHTGAVVDTLTGHSGRVLALAFADNGQTLFTAALDGAIFAWDLGTSTRFGRTYVTDPDAANQPGAKPAVALSPDGRRVATRHGAGRVAIHPVDAAGPTTTITLPHGADVAALAWSRRGVLAVALTSGGIQLWSAGAQPTLLRTLDGLKGSARQVAFSPAGDDLAAVAETKPKNDQSPSAGAFALWNSATGRVIASRPEPVPVAAVGWSDDGKVLATGDDKGRIDVMGSNAHVTKQFGGAFDGDSILDVAFLPDGDLLSGGYTGIVQRWNPDTGKTVGHAVLTEPGPASSLVVSPDGRHFAVSGGSSGGTKIWDVDTLQQYGATFPGGAGYWGNLAFTSDGSTLVAVYGDGTAAIWPVSAASWMAHACAVAGRNFTREEWRRFVPGHAYARTCPSYPAG
ncbi:MAG TPA: AAA family ATPase [Mycobacteriales bacterium]|nr:AAA family ATPase [Mycobacteriales bacterium]